MGKIVIASDKYKGIYDIINGFTNNGCIKGEYGTVATYKKLKVDTQNCYINEDDFIMAVGTFLYEKEMGESALRNILTNIELDNINEIRKRICGTFCMVVKKAGRLCVFTDNAGYYQIYYHIENEKDIVLTNTYYHIARVMDNVEVDIDVWMELVLGSEMIRNEAVFKDIYRLKPYEVLEYDFEKLIWETKKISTDIEDIKGDFWDDIRETYKVIADNIETHAVWCTAGQDSRGSLALLSSAGITPELYYGEGDSRITNTKEKEKEIVKSIAERFNYKFSLMNWCDSDNENIEEYINKYGEHVRLYTFNKNVFNELEHNINTKCLHTGILGANTFRIPDTSITEYKNEFTIDECIDDLGVGKVIQKSCKNWKQHREVIKERVENELQRLNINGNKMTKLDYCKITSYGRNDKLNNLFNMYAFCFPMLPEKKYEQYVLDLPYEKKIYSNFLLEGIYKLNKQLFEIPIISHHVLRYIDKDNLEIRNEQKGVEKIRKLLSPFWSTLRDSKIRELYFVLKKDDKGRKEFLEEKKTLKEILARLKKSIISEKYDVNVMVKMADPIVLSHLFIDEIVIMQALKNDK